MFSLIFKFIKAILFIPFLIIAFVIGAIPFLLMIGLSVIGIDYLSELIGFPYREDDSTILAIFIGLPLIYLTFKFWNWFFETSLGSKVYGFIGFFLDWD